MKLKLFTLISSLLLLSGCSFSESYIPSRGGSVIWSSTSEQQSASSSSQEISSEEEEEKNSVIDFYVNYTYSETPIFSIDWYMLKPLGAIPEQVSTEEKVLALARQLIPDFSIDPAFTKFLGFSYHGACLDDSDLWDFTKDYKQQTVTSLFGVWVSDSTIN